MLRALSRSKVLVLNLLVLGVIASSAFGIPGPLDEHLTIVFSTPVPPSDLPLTPLETVRSVLVPVAPAPQPVPATRVAESPVPEARLAAPESHALEMGTVRRSTSRLPSKTPLPPVSWNVFIHLPPNAAPHKSLRVLLVLHGMGGNGEKFAQNLIRDADQNNWVLVAPTVPYERDYMDPVQLMDEDLRFTITLNSLLQSLPEKLGLELRQHALVFGFSRGAQLGHRFALFYPGRVEAVAALSAGSYTLPLQVRNTQEMDFPYGIANLKKTRGEAIDLEHFKRISFYIAVGEKDNRTSDVARAFDPYVGQNRVERARAFDSCLESLGMDVRLTIFPGVGHEVTGDMRTSAIKFLRQDELADHWTD